MDAAQPEPPPTDYQISRYRLALHILVHEALADGVVLTVDQVIDNPCKPREFRMDINARPARGRY